LFAVTPALLLVGFLSRYIFSYSQIDVLRHTYAQIRTTLRDMERLLDLNLSSTTTPSSSRPVSLRASWLWHRNSFPVSQNGGMPEYDLRLEEAGRLLVSINALTNLAFHLPAGLRKWFLEDLQDLQAEELQVVQKLATIQRMYHTYPFLLPDTTWASSTEE